MARLYARRRRWLPARPSLYWASASGLALLTALVVGGLVTRAEAARAHWGDARPVVVATRTLRPGDVLGDEDVATERWPAGLVPDDAVEGAPVGAVVAAPIFEGQPLVRGQLAPDGLAGVAALLPPGTRALAVPVGSTLPVHVGDVVDVLATFDPTIAPDEDPTFAVAEAATVVGVGDDAVTVAVDAEDATRVAFAIAEGTVTLALRAP